MSVINAIGHSWATHVLVCDHLWHNLTRHKKRKKKLNRSEYELFSIFMLTNPIIYGNLQPHKFDST